MLSPPIGPPSLASILTRLVIVFGVAVAFQISAAKPNTPPCAGDRQRASGLERVLGPDLLWQFALCFSLGPVMVELGVALMQLGVPPDAVVLGSCAARIGFDARALAGLALSVCGTGVRLWCYRALGRLFTFELALLPGHTLVTTGPYAVVRHPSYAGGVLVLVGMTVANMSRGAWVYECGFAVPWGVGWGVVFVVSTVVMVERCVREDRFLGEAFGEEWDAWRKRVRWRMIPWVY